MGEGVLEAIDDIKGSLAGLCLGLRVEGEGPQERGEGGARQPGALERPRHEGLAVLQPSRRYHCAHTL